MRPQDFLKPSSIEVMEGPSGLTDQALQYRRSRCSDVLHRFPVMAKHPKRRSRKMGRYIRGNIDEKIPLGTLAPVTGLRQAVGDVLTEKARCTSVEALYSLKDLTAADNAGPIEIGVAHSDYSLVEIEEWIEQTTGWNEGDKVAKEISSRFIRRIGVFDAADLETVVLNDGRKIKTRLNWGLTTGQTLAFWVYNQGSAALSGTTNGDVHVSGHANLFPQ